MHYLFIAAIVLFSQSLFAAEWASAQAATRQYTFSWQFLEESALAPRGGTTQGANVNLMTEPTAEWKRLQQPGLTKFERDRRAILAMAGGYRSSFDFIEVAGFTAGFQPSQPYQSWGTEKVYVLQDTGKSIVLQHLLVMSIVDKDGNTQGPFVTKHWRQDWQYEPVDQLVYRGNNSWQRIAVPKAERAGQWRQTVYQVDDSPRYSGVAKWQHLANYSSWGDDNGWRPLPRREYSVRDDYQVLIGSNRQTITPTGWVHEQQNLKVVLDKNGKLDQDNAASNAVIAREFGLNRYERIRDYDWSAGDEYIKATEPVWKAVRHKWSQLIARNTLLRLKAAPDKDQMFMPLFEYAEQVGESEKPVAEQQINAKVEQLVDNYLAADSLKPGLTPAKAVTPAKY